MRELNKEERNFLNYLRKNCSRVKYNGYIYYLDKKTKKKYKRSRVIYQIYNSVKLNKFNLIHHIDNNKGNDNIENLKVLAQEEHNSLHCAGKRRSKK